MVKSNKIADKLRYDLIYAQTICHEKNRTLSKYLTNYLFNGFRFIAMVTTSRSSKPPRDFLNDLLKWDLSENMDI